MNAEWLIMDLDLGVYHWLTCVQLSAVCMVSLHVYNQSRCSSVVAVVHLHRLALCLSDPWDAGVPYRHHSTTTVTQRYVLAGQYWHRQPTAFAHLLLSSSTTCGLNASWLT